MHMISETRTLQGNALYFFLFLLINENSPRWISLWGISSFCLWFQGHLEASLSDPEPGSKLYLTTKPDLLLRTLEPCRGILQVWSNKITVSSLSESTLYNQMYLTSTVTVPFYPPQWNSAFWLIFASCLHIPFRKKKKKEIKKKRGCSVGCHLQV